MKTLRVGVLASLVGVLLGCTEKKSEPHVLDAAPLSTASVPVPAIVDASVPIDAALPRVMKSYKRVLHTGDSMVGGGLCRALKPMFEKDGTKFYRDVIESGTLQEFAQDQHLVKLLQTVKPDLVLMTLGSNHLREPDPKKEFTKYIQMITKRLEGIDCYWIAPPIWKKEYERFNQFLVETASPCKVYDGSALSISRRPDKIHPDEKGGEVWADDFWKYYKGDGAFLETTLR